MCASYNMDSRHYLSIVYLLSTRVKYKNYMTKTMKTQNPDHP